MKTPVLFHRPDFCPRCKRNTIEVFDYFNNPMGYTKIIDRYEKRAPVDDLLNRRAIYRMRCKSCSKVYAIRWDGPYPIPDVYPTHENNREFIAFFSQMNK